MKKNPSGKIYNFIFVRKKISREKELSVARINCTGSKKRWLKHVPDKFAVMSQMYLVLIHQVSNGKSLMSYDASEIDPDSNILRLNERWLCSEFDNQI